MQAISQDKLIVLTAAERVRDDLVVQDVRLRRVIGGEQRFIAKLTDQFEKRVKAAIVEIDVGGVNGPLRRTQRMVKLEKIIKELAQEHYAEVAAHLKKTMQGVAIAESQAVTGALEESVATF